MARSHKPIVWSLFAAGGTAAAFVTPVMILVTGLTVTLGLLPAETLSYDRVSAALASPIGKVLVFFAILLPGWHAAHRLRITAHDFGLRADGAVAAVCYGLAAVATVVVLVVLIAL